jgi:hypothetical protein
MKGNILLEELLPTLQRVGTTDKNIQLYKEIQNSINNFEIIDSFYQLKRNDKGEGLAFEIMLFNEHYVYDIVVTSATIDLNIALVKNVSGCQISSSYGPVKDENGANVLTDLLTLVILFEGEPKTLYYLTEVKRFPDVIRIKNNLLKTAQK